MSWDRIRYRAVCDGCGQEGVRVEATDDWNRTETTFEGFYQGMPDATALARKRISSGSPRCPVCGGTSISGTERLTDH
jgi:hypothetical protein